MSGRIVGALLLCAVAAGTARAQSPVTLVRSLDAQLHVYQPTRSQGFPTPLREVVRTKTRWDQIWDQLLPGWTEGGYKRPPVDFSREMLLVAGEGTFGTTGPDVHIDSVYAHGDTLFASLTSVVNWGRACLGGSEVTAPVDIVRVPTQTGPVIFVEHPKRNPACYD